jgi:type II secretory pathway pseudopilin PulG
MNLAARARCHLRQNRDAGYAMAALLVAMAVMAVLLTVAMPTWKQANQREKEAELLFRLTQYNRAIAAYGKAHGSPGPPNIDALVNEHFLRKKYKDPVSGEGKDDFQICYASTQGGASAATCSTNPTGVIIGVVSKNKGTSIAYFLEDSANNTYDKWLSQLAPLPPSPQAQGAGGQGPGTGRGGGMGGVPGAPGSGTRGGGTGGGREGGRRGVSSGDPSRGGDRGGQGRPFELPPGGVPRGVR